MKEAILLGLTWLMLTGISPGRESGIKFHKVTDESGSLGSSIYNIYQDREGFLWLGNSSGLTRYDGYRFQTYSHDPDDPDSISDDNVFTILEGREGYLWVGTQQGGLNRFDRETETFRRYQHDPHDPDSLTQNNIYSLLEDAKGNLWLGTMGGLDRLDRENQRFVHYRHNPEDPDSLSSDHITWLYQSPSEPDILWIATADGGLNQLNIPELKFSSFRHDPRDPASLSSDHTLSVCMGPDGDLWVCTARGVNRYREKENRFQHFQHDPLDSSSISHDHAFTITHDDEGRLWIGTMGKGVNIIDPVTGDALRLSWDPDDPDSLSGDEVNHVYTDRKGTVWVGTTRGLNQYLPYNQKYQNLRHVPHYENSLSADQVHGVCLDRRGNIWIATAHGLNCLDADSGRINRFYHQPGNSASLSNDTTYTVTEDTDGSLWIGTLTGLDHLDLSSGDFTRYTHEPERLSSLSHNRIYSVCRDSSGYLWVGCWVGLNRSTGKENHYLRFFEEPADPGEWYKNTFNIILEDSDRTLWFGTRGGGLYRCRRGEFARFSRDREDQKGIPGNRIYHIYEDSRKRLWVATERGLCQVSDRDRPNPVFERVRPADEAFMAIVEDSQGRIWVSSFRDLWRLDSGSKRLEHMAAAQSLKMTHFEEGIGLCDRGGRLWFGGSNGLVSFIPGDLPSNERFPPVKITGIILHGRRGLRQRLSPPSREIRISYRDFPLHLEYTTLDYSRSIRSRYAYRIDDLSDEWIPAGRSRSITLTSLKPGAHQIRIRNTPDRPSGQMESDTLRVVVIPPFWRTSWFKLGMILVIALALLCWHRSRMVRLTRKLKTEAAMDKFLSKHDISDREREVLLLILKGKTNREIEDELYISLRTVKNHVYNIFQKLGVSTRVKLMTLFKNLDVK